MHEQGQRRVLVGLRGPLLQTDCAAWAFAFEGGPTSYQPVAAVESGLLKGFRPGVPTDEGRLAAMFGLLDVLLFNSPDAAIHLAGPTEATRQALDFSFRLPDALLPVPRGERQINENFARLEERRFVRALLPLPVLGGEEFRIGMWFEVSSADFEAVLERVPVELSGLTDNSFSIEARPLAGVIARLGLEASQPCPRVLSADATWLNLELCEVRSSDEHFALVREITDSYTKAQVARARSKG